MVVGTIACQPPGTSELGSRGSSASALAPSYWPAGQAAFPLNVKISQDFLSNESDAISTSASNWSGSVDNRVTFFNTTSTTTEKGGSLGSYNDGEFGIYKLTTWPAELPGSALAVTQIFGLRKNIGSSNESIEITHADIMVNYDNFSFSTNNGSGYDLETVVLHEFGHFLGLGHDSSSVSQSVMYPTISRYTSSRSPLENDISNLKELYGISGATQSNAGFRGIASISERSEQSSDPGELVVIQFEINADGSERVKVNNKYIEHNCKH
jgi:hypothetical protein